MVQKLFIVEICEPFVIASTITYSKLPAQKQNNIFYLFCKCSENNNFRFSYLHHLLSDSISDWFSGIIF